MDPATIIYLKSNDGTLIEVPYGTITKSKMIVETLENMSNATEIPLPNVTGEILNKVVEWCKHHKDEPEPVEEEGDPLRMRISTDISDWDKAFFDVDQSKLRDLILAANFLHIKGMLDTGCKTVANMIKGKTTEQLRELFDLEDDFTEEEKEKIRKEYAWADDADENQATA